MFEFQQKFQNTQGKGKEEKFMHIQEKEQSVETVTEKVHTLKLLHKYFNRLLLTHSKN